jgi:hypothetical protein
VLRHGSIHSWILSGVTGPGNLIRRPGACCESQLLTGQSSGAHPQRWRAPSRNRERPGRPVSCVARYSRRPQGARQPTTVAIHEPDASRACANRAPCSLRVPGPVAHPPVSHEDRGPIAGELGSSGQPGRPAHARAPVLHILAPVCSSQRASPPGASPAGSRAMPCPSQSLTRPASRSGGPAEPAGTRRRPRAPRGAP